MIEDRYLLGKDLPGILQRAGRHWDYLMTSGTAPSEGR